MRRYFTLFLVLSLVLVVPALVQAENHPSTGAGDMGGMDMGGSGSAVPEDPNYTPVEARADDGGMAMIAALVFGGPVVAWLVARGLKRSLRPRNPRG